MGVSRGVTGVCAMGVSQGRNACRDGDRCQAKLESHEPSRVLSLVHFSAQPELYLSLASTETTQHIPQKVLTSSRKVDGRKLKDQTEAFCAARRACGAP